MAASPNFPKVPSDWSSEEFFFRSRSLFMRVWWDPRGRSGRALYLVHGFGENSDRYEHFPHYLRGSVDAIAAIDLPGHGRSKGERGHCDRFGDLTVAAIEGLGAFQEWLSGRNLSPRLHWMGHSLGGLTTLRALANRPDLPLVSMIVSAPLLGLSMPVPGLKKFFGEMITPLLPRLPLTNEINGAKLSRDPSVGIEYRRNPLNHSKITPKMFQEMTRTMDQVVRWKGPLPFSTLMILPLNDEIVDARLTLKKWREWNVAEGKKRELQMWPGASHESFNDLIKEPVFNGIESWLRKA